MNNNNLSLQQKIDFIKHYLYDNFGTKKSELKHIPKNKNLYLFDIYFDSIKLRFNFIFSDIDYDNFNEKIIILNTASEKEVKELIHLTKFHSFNRAIIDNHTLDILKKNNEIVSLILSINSKQKELTNISYDEFEIESLYQLLSIRNNIHNF